LSGAGATQGVVPDGIRVSIDDAANGLFHLLELGSGEMCFKHTVLDTGTKPFEHFGELTAPSVVWNIVRDDIEHRMNLRCFFGFRFELTLGYQPCRCSSRKIIGKKVSDVV